MGKNCFHCLRLSKNSSKLIGFQSVKLETIMETINRDFSLSRKKVT